MSAAQLSKSVNFYLLNLKKAFKFSGECMENLIKNLFKAELRYLCS